MQEEEVEEEIEDEDEGYLLGVNQDALKWRRSTHKKLNDGLLTGLP